MVKKEVTDRENQKLLLWHLYIREINKRPLKKIWAQELWQEGVAVEAEVIL